MKNLLFPHWFQFIGWILFIPAIVLGILLLADFLQPTGILETVLNDIVIIGVALGSMFIVCSKEKNEDEMTRQIRLSSLLNALYVYVILLVSCTVFINGADFFWFMVVDLVLLPIIYVVLFRLEMYRCYKMGDNEE